MPRKGHIAKRTVPSDAVYQSDLVTKFINSMMWQGKRSTAEGIFYESLEAPGVQGRRRSAEAVQEGGGERQAAARGEDPPRGRRELSGAGRGECRPPHFAGDPLAD